MVESGDRARRQPGDGGTGFLPEQSLLELSDYLAMQRAIGNKTRFRVLSVLVEAGAMTPTELENRLEIADNTLHYHLDELVDVGLVENRKRTESGRKGLYSYYRATSLGKGILTHGVRELIEEEWDALQAYSSGTEDVQRE